MTPLNAGQDAAARGLVGNVLVSAGAGSGKTRMLTQRFINSVTPGEVPGWPTAAPEDIVTITFTDKAAGELAERVRTALRAAGLRAEARALDAGWISTIHGLCTRILKRHALGAGLDPMFSVADAVEAGSFRIEAFEGSSRELLDSSAATAELFDAYGFERVFACVREIARTVATHGLDVDALVLEPAPETERVVRDVLELIDEGAGACEGYAGGAEGVANYRALCARQREACAQLVDTTLPSSERLEACGALLAEHSLFRSNTKGMEEAHASLKAKHERLVARVAAALAAPHAAALKRLASAYVDMYGRLKAEAGVLDFDDLQMKAVELLERRTDIAAQYASQFRLVMVDEFQDTDALQLRLIRALSQGNLCTVGDEKQSIYRFRGADVDVYRWHAQQMRADGALVVELDTNYRSHPEILGFANDIFGSDTYFGDDLMRFRAPDAPRPAYVLDGKPRLEVVLVDSTSTDSETARMREAEEVAARFAELANAGVDASEMAILVRRYRHAHVYADALSRAGLAAVIVGGSRFFELAEVALMRALIRVIANSSDDEALGRVLASEVGLSDDALACLGASRGAGDRRSLWEALVEAAPNLEGRDSGAAACFMSAIGSARGRIGTMRLSEVLLRLVEDSGLDVVLLSQGNTGRDALANVLKVVRYADAFELSGSTGPAGFAAWLDAKERFGDVEAPVTVADDQARAVRIMSVHASKGLEFPVVAVVDIGSSGNRGAEIVRMGVADGAMRLALRAPGDWPTRGGLNFAHTTWYREIADALTQSEHAEDDRVLYVAFTRAREYLLVGGSYKLRPKKPPIARNDLVRLAGLLGVGIPVAGESDAVEILASAEACRVRVVDAGTSSDSAGDLGRALAGDVPPRCREPLPSTRLLDAMPRQISYSHIDAFERCGRRFYYERILGIREAQVVLPGEGDPRRFGSAVHGALQIAGPELPDASRLKAIAAQYGLDETETGRLVDTVEAVVRSSNVREAWAGATVRRECPFAIPLSGGRFSLVGAIDLYSRTAADALIVDYKTGASGEPEELAQRYRLQAECYALAALRDGATRVRVVFSRPEVTAPDGSPQEIPFEFGPEDEARIEAQIVSIYDRIAQGPHNPSGAFDATTCRECSAGSGGLCDVSPRLNRPHAV